MKFEPIEKNLDTPLIMMTPLTFFFNFDMDKNSLSGKIQYPGSMIVLELFEKKKYIFFLKKIL